MLIITIFVCSLVVTSYGRVIESEFSPRIINGERATLGEIPYQVSLQYKDKIAERPDHFCGGSIFNENYVITAAHCVLGMSPGKLQVVDGIVDLQAKKSIHFVSKIIIHKDYSPDDSYLHDIALVKVATPFKLSKTVSPVKLPQFNSKVSADKKAVVSGWGYTRINGQVSRFLQKVTVLIADQEYCRKVYVPLKANVYETHICAHDPIAEHGSCQGDSGGPLTVDGVLVGIVSWAMECARVNYPTVFTRVPKYVDWIKKHAV